MSAADDLPISRREALAGAAATLLTALSSGTAAANHNPSGGPVGDFAIQLGGLDSNGLPVLDAKGRQRFIYIAPDELTSSGGDRFYYTTWHDDQWFELNLGSSPFSDSDSDGLLETSSSGVDIDEQIIRDKVRFPTGNGDEYTIQAQQEKLTVTNTDTGEVVGAINEHGVLLPTSPVFTSDTTVRSRTEIFQCDTNGLGGSITLTIGTELENADQIFAVKDVGGAAGQNQIQVEAESGSDIDGQSTASINSNYGRLSAYYSAAEGQWFSLFTSL
jgi:hypothetical protein